MKLSTKQNLQRELIPDSSTITAPQKTHGSRIGRIREKAIGMRRKAATVLLIVLSCSLGLYAIFGHDGIVAYQHKQQEARHLQQQILEVQKENQRMALHNQRLKNDRDTIEYEAREQMHYTRPGEVIYTLPQAPKAAARK